MIKCCMPKRIIWRIMFFTVSIFLFVLSEISAQDLLGCGGFVKSSVPITYSKVDIKLFTKQGSLKYQTDCAPNNGYYLVPIYDKGDYILKVDPPEGWIFAPTSVSLHLDGQTDPCSEGIDLNFIFKGFKITGQVVSKGSADGPTGVTLSLLDSEYKELNKDISQKNGQYAFNNILPGTYTVRAAHPKWQFEKSQTRIVVSENSLTVADRMVVTGYDVQGQVTSEGEPVKGVHFVLFANNGQINSDIKGCVKALPAGFKGNGQRDGLCYVTSDQNGNFVFPLLPVGQFTVVPYYGGENVKFEVSPSSYNFTVQHNSLFLPQKFEVQGFSVGGIVVSSKGGHGIPNASVLVNGKKITSTNSRGIYHLDNMKAGSYNIRIEADQIYFDPVTVRINPNTPDLPDIIASAFEVCGQAVLTRPIPNLSAPVRSIKIEGFEVTSLPQPMSVQADMDGKICTKLPPGIYTLQVVVTDAEARSGLKFVPDIRNVEVIDKPISGITFNQFSATVKGKVDCIQQGECQGIPIRIERVESGKTDTVTVSDKLFQFTNILPGQYKLTVAKEDWCWDDISLTVQVTDKDVTNVVFHQNGYLMRVSSSHPTSLSYFVTNEKLGDLDIKKGTNSFCMSKPGVYTFTTSSCHVFNTEDLSYSTSNPALVALYAKQHLISGSVSTEVSANDITVTLKTVGHQGKVTEVSTGPLKEVVTLEGGLLRYKFSHWGSPGDVIEFTATSSQLLFPPQLKTVTVVDDCMEDAVQLVGRKGLFIYGAITPALEKVKIVITATDGSMEPITMYSDKDGQYRVGPLQDLTTYDVTAERQGYVLSKDEKFGHFEAFKLAEVIVAVVNEKGEKLPGALLSLSGDGDYRQNSITQDDGRMVFTGLSPGQYFIRPMMKEFKFEPQSNMFELREGATVNIKFTGHQVAFSCYGTVSSLSGEPEGKVVIEAVGMDNCEPSHEVAATESDGSFRIRGLQPNCLYTLTLKRSPDVNQHVERIVPPFKSVEIKSSDVSGVSLIMFRPVSLMDLSGNILTSSEYLNSLKVILTKEDSDHALHTANIGISSFFQLPMIPLDGSQYTLSLTTSLSRNLFDFQLPEIIFKANETYRHFPMVFSPRPRSSEHDMNQGSYIALPLAILAILAVANHAKLLPLLGQAGEFIQSARLSSPGRGTDNSGNAETVPAKKKLKARKT